MGIAARIEVVVLVAVSRSLRPLVPRPPFGGGRRCGALVRGTRLPARVVAAPLALAIVLRPLVLAAGAALVVAALAAVVRALFAALAGIAARQAPDRAHVVLVEVDPAPRFRPCGRTTVP